MKCSILMMTLLLLISCSSTQLVESWKNQDIEAYEPYKVLIVGLTSHEAARQQFEIKLKNEFKLRGYEAVMSQDVLDNTTKSDKMTEAQLNTLANQLVEDGFVTILLTKIIGVADRVAYCKNY